MDPRRLELLLELSRLGSMRGGRRRAARHHLDGLPADRGAGPRGRRRAGRAGRPAGPADPGRAPAGRPRRDGPGRDRGGPADLDPAAEPAGTVRVAAFATAVRAALLPVVRGAGRRATPTSALLIHEHEPAEALDLLATDDIDLALTYDYNLAPGDLRRAPWRPSPLWETAWGLGVPAGRPRRPRRRAGGVRPLPRQRLDRELPQHRRRGRGAHGRLAGRLRAPGRAPRRQPRAGAGHDRRRPRRRAAARRTSPPAAGSGCCRCATRGSCAARLRRDPPRPPAWPPLAPGR